MRDGSINYVNVTTEATSNLGMNARPTNSIFFNRKGFVVAVSLAAFVASAVLSRADEDAQKNKAEAAAPPAHLENVDESLYGTRGPKTAPAIRERLDRILRRRLSSAEKVRRLSKIQVQKLELAGRGDINRLLSLIEEHSQKLRAAGQAVNEVYNDNPLNRQTSAIRSRLRSGPFDEDSLFAKSLKKILTTEQVASSEERQRTATGSLENISLDNAGDIMRTSRLKRNIYRIVFNRDGNRVALVEFDKIVEVYEFPEMRLVRALGEGLRPVDFDFAPTDDLSAIAMNSRDAAILNVRGEKQTKLETGNSQPDVAFNPTNSLLVTGGYGVAAKMWSVSNNEQIREFDMGGRAGGLTPVFSPDGAMLAVGNRNSATYLFDVQTGRALHILPKVMSHGLAFDPSGKTLAVTYVDGGLVLWDTASGKQKGAVQALANELYTVDWSTDGRILATAGYNAPVTLWNAEDLSILDELECPEWVFSLKFSPDGSRLLFAGSPRIRTADKFVEIWAAP